MLENTDQNNSEYGHFLRSGGWYNNLIVRSSRKKIMSFCLLEEHNTGDKLDNFEFEQTLQKH